MVRLCLLLSVLLLLLLRELERRELTALREHAGLVVVSRVL